MLQRNPFLTRPLTPGSQENPPKEQPGIEAAVEPVTPDYQAAGFYPTYRLARAYVVRQKYGPLFSPAEALEKGTIFPDLYSPYPF